MSINELKDAFDAQQILVPEHVPTPDRITYYDDMNEYRLALRRAGYDDEAALRHEKIHGACAEAVGVTAVRYGVEYRVYSGIYIPQRAVTIKSGPCTIPRLALAAVAAAPPDPSADRDLLILKKYGYPSVDHLAERIGKWNSEDHGLFIPMPGSIEIPDL